MKFLNHKNYSSRATFKTSTKRRSLIPLQAKAWTWDTAEFKTSGSPISFLKVCTKFRKKLLKTSGSNLSWYGWKGSSATDIYKICLKSNAGSSNIHFCNNSFCQNARFMAGFDLGWPHHFNNKLKWYEWKSDDKGHKYLSLLLHYSLFECLLNYYNNLM